MSQQQVPREDSVSPTGSSSPATVDTADEVTARDPAVSADEQLSPVRIVGAAASWALVRALAVSGGSAVWAIAQLLQSKL